jgi:type I restriction enzyme S subunit
MEKTKYIPRLRFPEFNGEWEKKKLGGVTEIFDGTHQTPKYVEQGIPFYSVEQLTANNFRKTKFVTKEVFEKENNRVKIEKGDILMTRIGDIGTSRYIDWEVNASFYVSIVLIKQSPKFNSKFLHQFIGSKFFQNELWNRTIHVAFPKKINLGEIGNCLIYLPNLQEQTDIASFLTTVDNKLQTLKQKKTLLDQYKKGVMKSIFSQEIQFMDNDGNDYPDWEEKKLSEVANKKSSNISANKIEDNFGDYIIYGASGILKKVDFYKEENDYISIVKDGAGVGRLLYCKGQSSVLGTMEIIRPNKQIDTYYLYCLLSNIDFVKYVTGSTIPHIYFKDYSSELCRIPCLEEQTKIAHFLSAIDEKIKHCQEQITSTEVWKKGLLQQMFV